LDLASFKATIVALYYLHREWSSNIPSKEKYYPEHYRALMRVLINDVKSFMYHRSGKERLYRIYKKIVFLLF